MKRRKQLKTRTQTFHSLQIHKNKGFQPAPSAALLPKKCFPMNSESGANIHFVLYYVLLCVHNPAQTEKKKKPHQEARAEVPLSVNPTLPHKMCCRSIAKGVLKVSCFEHLHSWVHVQV